MLRSNRVRKPSQKAREIAEAMELAKSTSSASTPDGKTTKSNSRPKKPYTSSSRAKVKVGGKKGRAMVNSEGGVDVQVCPNPHDSDAIEVEDDENALYCVCLGRDDHTPMIQCESCENWFHFSCIQLNAQEAQKIEAFYCEVCQASGTGPTRKVDEEVEDPSCDPVSPAPEQSPGPINCNDEEVIQPTVSTDSPQKASLGTGAIDPQITLMPENPDTTQPGDSPTSGTCPSKDRPTSLGNDMHDSSACSSTVTPRSSTKANRRRVRKAEGLSSDEDDAQDDTDFVGELGERSVTKRRKTATSTESRRPVNLGLTFSPSSNPMPISGPATPATGFDKTRRACIEQFYKLLQPTFSHHITLTEGSALPDATNQPPEEAAMKFAEAVESELFDSFGELDSRNDKMPRRQYMAKFRSLLFNFKNNPALLNSLSSSDLSPKCLVHMSNQDLQTPEQKALAAQLRQRSLQDSVRTLIPPPKAKITHKGEEAIEPFEPLESAKDHPGGPVTRHEFDPTTDSSTSLERTSSQPNPARPIGSASPSPQLPTFPVSPEKALSEDSAESRLGPDSKMTMGKEVNASKSQRPSMDLISSFDLESVFAAMKSVPTASSATANAKASRTDSSQDQANNGRESDDSMDLEDTPERENEGDGVINGSKDDTQQLPEDYDPFAIANGVDADLDAILHDEPSSTTPPTEPLVPWSQSLLALSLSEATQPKTATTITQPVLWAGNVMTADAGGFAASAIQVGGRPLSTDPSMWARIIPTETMTVVGRLPVKDSTNYLVQSHFAASRELVILELMPNLKGPPDLPSPERVLQHQQNLIDFFTKKGRHAVVSVNDKVKQTVRDIYLVPLLKGDPLPEFVQLLDDVTIPEFPARPKDMIIAVLVLQKGAIPSGWRASPESSNPTAGHGPSSSAPALSLSSSHLSSLQQPPYPAPRPGSSARFPPPMATAMPLSQPIQPAPSALPSNSLDPIPILQSLTSTFSGNPRLPFTLLSQLPLSLPTSTPPGPPPGFVPYVAPQTVISTATSSSMGPPSTGVDLSKVDVGALQALLSSQQAVKPTYPPIPSNSNFAPTSINHHPSHPAHYRNASPHFHHPTNQSSPSLPRPPSLPPNPNLNHQSWGPDHSGSSDNRQRRKGLMRMGEVVRSLPHEERRRSSGGGSSGGGKPKRMQEFVAPAQDGGWAGRGRGRGKGRISG